MTDRTEFESAPVHSGDPHDSIDVREVLSEVTVVIPTNRDDNYTLDSLPEYVPRVTVHPVGAAVDVD